MTETNLMNFNFNNIDVRIQLKKDAPLFCLGDICKVLGLQNPIHLKNAIDIEFNKGGTFDVYPLKTSGGIQDFLFITEPELYFVLMRSDKPQAKPFRQWVLNEVLPSIRKHGAYLTPQKLEEVLLNPDTIIQLATELKTEREKAQQLSQQNQQLQIANDEKQEFIEVIQDSGKSRVYKKNLRAECNRIAKIINAKYDIPFKDIWDRAYKILFNQHFVDWKYEFYQAQNKLSFLALKDICYLKDLKDILISMSKPDKTEVTA